jgi:hypothetical protein
VIWDDRPSDSIAQIQLGWSRVGDQVKVYVISPNGLLDTGGGVRFSIILAPPNTYTFTGAPPSLVSSAYYDIDGISVAGTDPEVVLMY